MNDDDVAQLPLFPLGTVLFPTAPLPLRIFEERYRRLMADREGHDPIFGVVLTRQGREVADQPEIYAVGTAATLLHLHRFPDGRYDIAVVGGRRFRVLGGDWSKGYLVGTVRWLDEPAGEPGRLRRLRQEAVTAFASFVEVVARMVDAQVPEELLPEDPTEASYAIAARLPVDTWERQALLEIAATDDRLAELTSLLRREHRLLTKTGAAGAVVEHPGSRFTEN